MNDINNEKLQYWIVKLGNLFYTGGLHRLSKENQNIEGYDFANSEAVAFPIMLEEIAERIAIKVGGIAICREGTVKDVVKLSENNEYYAGSSKQWVKEQLESFKEQLIYERD